jgi:manganese efflux pump family protein
MLSIFLIGIALSMDAFSIAICFGTLKISKIKFMSIPIIVGIMHFIMPLIGLYLGNQILAIFKINPKIIISIILLFLAYMMYKDKDNSKKTFITSFASIFLFAFSVSLDSFSVGLGLQGITDKYLLSCLVFSACSGTITYMGLLLGKYSIKKLKENSTMLGIAILITIALVNICKLLFF